MFSLRKERKGGSVLPGKSPQNIPWNPQKKALHVNGTTSLDGARLLSDISIVPWGWYSSRDLEKWEKWTDYLQRAIPSTFSYYYSGVV